MKSYFGYIRVSTVKQGRQSVSLIEQKDAIERYAVRHGIEIVEWFEEQETAAKRGRPVFTHLLSLLRKGSARGVVIHKIDRSARNLTDWADLGELIDAGVEVHFAADALDLHSRGGRLAADIQAIVAADYIRNLREEAKKGIYGRFKQGLYPLPAPVGYENKGKGKPKELDPKFAPLVREAFELYATGEYSLRTLLPALRALGLTTRRGGTLSIGNLATILHNPFYCGIIRVRTSGHTFPGIHAPIVSVALFKRVQAMLERKAVGKVVRHAFRYRRTIRCACCTRLLTGERQKGHVYYRCHTSACRTTGVREDFVDAALRTLYALVELTPDEATDIRDYFLHRSAAADKAAEKGRRGISLRIADAKARLMRLTDALIDGAIDRPAHDTRREALLVEIAGLEERLNANFEREGSELEKLFELASSLVSSHDLADDAQKRRLVQITTSNFSVSGKELAITLSEPFLALSKRHGVLCGGPERDRLRTTEKCRSIRMLVKRFLETTKTEARNC